MPRLTRVVPVWAGELSVMTRSLGAGLRSGRAEHHGWSVGTGGAKGEGPRVVIAGGRLWSASMTQT